MHGTDILNRFTKLVKANSSEIFTALSISGVISTSYFTGKAAFEAARIIDENEKIDEPWLDARERFRDRARQTWKLYIPAGVSGVFTIGCILGSTRSNARRTAAAVTAYSLTERAFTDYREKVVEQLGKGKEQKLRDELAQDRVSKAPTSNQVVIAGSGQVLCCELFTGRYFRSDMETLRKAQNDINAKIINDLYVVLDEFYALIGLAYTSDSNILGWNSDKLMELHFSTVLADNGEPCLAFEYNYTKPVR